MKRMRCSWLSIRCGLAGLAVAAALPMWQVWHVGQLEATGECGFAWQAVLKIPNQVHEVGAFYGLFDYQAQNALFAAAVFAIAGMIGRAQWDAIHQRRDVRRQARGLCLQCGYNLRGNESGKCPECGCRCA